MTRIRNPEIPTVPESALFRVAGSLWEIRGDRNQPWTVRLRSVDGNNDVKKISFAGAGSGDVHFFLHVRTCPLEQGHTGVVVSDGDGHLWAFILWRSPVGWVRSHLAQINNSGEKFGSWFTLVVSNHRTRFTTWIEPDRDDATVIPVRVQDVGRAQPSVDRMTYAEISKTRTGFVLEGSHAEFRLDGNLAEISIPREGTAPATQRLENIRSLHAVEWPGRGDDSTVWRIGVITVGDSKTRWLVVDTSSEAVPEWHDVNDVRVQGASGASLVLAEGALRALVTCEAGSERPAVDLEIANITAFDGRNEDGSDGTRSVSDLAGLAIDRPLLINSPVLVGGHRATLHGFVMSGLDPEPHTSGKVGSTIPTELARVYADTRSRDGGITSYVDPTWLQSDPNPNSLQSVGQTPDPEQGEVRLRAGGEILEKLNTILKLEERGNTGEIANAALEELRNREFSVYLVGGCVRDVLLGKDPNDVDLLGTAPFTVLIRTLVSKQLEANSDSIYFLVNMPSEGGVLAPYLARREEAIFEYALPKTKFLPGFSLRPREDSAASVGSWLFGFSGKSSLKLDAGFRDLTINSLLYDPVEKEILDPGGWIEHIGWTKAEIASGKRDDANALRLTVVPPPLPEESESPAWLGVQNLTRIVKKLNDIVNHQPEGSRKYEYQWKPLSEWLLASEARVKISSDPLGDLRRDFAIRLQRSLLPDWNWKGTEALVPALHGAFSELTQKSKSFMQCEDGNGALDLLTDIVEANLSAEARVQKKKKKGKSGTGK